jgi:gluconolactonase
MRQLSLLLVFAAGAIAAEQYPLGPDSQRQPGVPQGKVTQHRWTSKIYPGTERNYWVYVPRQYDGSAPAAVMVFQDGSGYVREDGRWRVPVVFDNLIHRGQMPVTIGIFIDPGVLPAPHENAEARYNRSFEYDALGDRYARFLLEEILPEVGKTYKLTDDPNMRAIAGSSSGGICAFTAAWNRPDAFRRVLSFIGSFVNLRGGHIYPTLIRKTEPKPLRVFLQDGNRDLNIYSGSWWIANQDMAAALEFAGYDAKFVTGTEAHNSIHGSSILPEALIWLWRDWKQPVRAAQPGNRRGGILEPGMGWELVSEGHRFTEGPAVDKAGNLFFTDVPDSKIWKVDANGKVSLFKQDSGNANGLMFGPDGKLYACQNGRQRIVAYDMNGAETVIAEGVQSNDLVVNARGEIYFTDPRNNQVWFIDAQRNKRVVHNGLTFPNGVMLSPDQTLLTVADSRTKWVWSFQIQPDGSLAHGQPFYRMETHDENDASGADGMTMDTEGRLYVATRIGLQICDQPGRVNLIVNKPHPGPLSNVAFGGPDMQTLYVTAGDKVFKRRVRSKGVLPWQPVKPPRPRL